MNIKCKLLKELDNGGAIVSMELDEDAKDWLIGEGFIKVLQESLKNSKTYISADDVKRITAKKTTPKKHPITPKKSKIVPKKGKK
jgi:hypothetical protein